MAHLICCIYLKSHFRLERRTQLEARDALKNRKLIPPTPQACTALMIGSASYHFRYERDVQVESTFVSEWICYGWSFNFFFKTISGLIRHVLLILYKVIHIVYFHFFSLNLAFCTLVIIKIEEENNVDCQGGKRCKTKSTWRTL